MSRLQKFTDFDFDNCVKMAPPFVPTDDYNVDRKEIKDDSNDMMNDLLGFVPDEDEDDYVETSKRFKRFKFNTDIEFSTAAPSLGGAKVYNDTT